MLYDDTNLEPRVGWCEYVFGSAGAVEYAVQQQTVANSGKCWGFVIADFQ
jgi:hypothetical protein